MPWQEWDRCWRIRSVVGEKFVDRKLDVGAFVNLTSDAELWKLTASTISQLWHGRSYLKRVQNFLRSESDVNPDGTKAAILDEVL
jgi:hypothetical protein